MLVKICGITNLEDGQKAIEAGADFVGLVLDSSAKRGVEEGDAFDLIKEFKTYPVHVIGFFLENDLSIVAQRAKDLNLDWVQIVAPKHKSELEPLKNFKKLLVLRVSVDGSYEPLLYSVDEGDYLDYDYKTFGLGKSFDWDSFKRIESDPFFLAGGLNVQNVANAVEKIKPQGVDVSSGVCTQDKRKKDSKKIKEFIESVR